MKTANRILSFVLIAILVLALLPVGVGFAEGPFVSDGYDPDADLVAGVRFRNFNSQGSRNREAYLGDPDEFPSGIYSPLDITWKSPKPTSSNPFTFSYNAGVLSLQVNGTYEVAREIGDLGSLNYIKLEVKCQTCAQNKAAVVELQNFTVNNMPVPVDFSVDGKQSWSVTGMDLSAGFKIEGDIYLEGSPQPGGELNTVEIGVGYTEVPMFTDVVVNPNPVYLHGDGALIASVMTDNYYLDDTTNPPTVVNLTIGSADYSLNNDVDWVPGMIAQDGAFDSPAETAIHPFFAADELLGENYFCVHARDNLGNLSDDLCADFSVRYRKYGFFDPVSNDLINEVKAGQAVPFKWQLTDDLGKPISDTNSVVGIYAYEVACDADPSEIIEVPEESSSGASGLQYIDDGDYPYWQFNWKTSKSYSDSCRDFYILFKDEHAVGARFKFK